METKILFAIVLSYLAIVNATPFERDEADDLEIGTGATDHLITTLAENKTTGTAHLITVTAANKTTGTAHLITVTAANVTAANMTTAKHTTHHNITVVPITNTAGTVDTSMVTITNAGTIDTTMLTHSKTAKTRMSTAVTSTHPPTTLAPSRSFDGASFAGGIALGLGLCIIVLIVYKCYTSRTTRDYNKM